MLRSRPMASSASSGAWVWQICSCAGRGSAFPSTRETLAEVRSSAETHVEGHAER